MRIAGLRAEAGILGHVRDGRAPQPLTLERREREDVAPLDRVPRRRAIARSAARVAEHREADGRLAGARLADEPEHLARRRPGT